MDQKIPKDKVSPILSQAENNNNNITIAQGQTYRSPTHAINFAFISSDELKEMVITYLNYKARKMENMQEDLKKATKQKQKDKPKQRPGQMECNR